MFNLEYQLIITLPIGEQIIIPTEFTCSFSISRQNMSSSANNATFSVYNLNPTNRNKIFKDAYNPSRYIRLEFFAGYSGQISSIYRGSIVQAQTKPSGNDNILEIETQDGMFDSITTQSNVSFPAGTSRREVAEKLVGDFPNVEMGGAGKAIDGTYKRPYVTEGNTYDALKNVCNANLYIDGETIHFLEDDEALKAGATVISSETGLASVAKQDTTLKIETKILTLGATVGSMVELISTRNPIYNGQYKVVGVEHNGTISEGVSSATNSLITVLDTNTRFGATELV